MAYRNKISDIMNRSNPREGAETARYFNKRAKAGY